MKRINDELQFSSESGARTFFRGQTVLATFFVLIAGAFFQTESSRADSTQDLAKVRKQFIERNVAFKSVLEARKKEQREDEVGRVERKRQRAEAARLEEQYREAHLAMMKRYSMEEAERLDREDEERIEREISREDLARARFVELRDQSLEIESQVGTPDPYLELDIDLKKQPDSKTSWTEIKHTDMGEGKESF